MTVQEAELVVAREWQSIAEQRVGYPLRVDPTHTAEYEWGWEISFVPAEADRPPRRERYAIDRVTGITSPVGTKGLSEAVRYLAKWRRQREAEAAARDAGAAG